MIKSTSNYICQSCDYQAKKWFGQCPGCGDWNTMVETSISSSPAGFGAYNHIYKNYDIRPLKLNKVVGQKIKRYTTKISEFDRVLGGGIVPGSLTLVAGAPGVGKSSLLTKVVSDVKGLYVLGEESPQQVKMRVERFNLNMDFEVLSETQAEKVASVIKDQSLVVIDSIQTLWTERLKGVAGSVGQIRESAQLLLQVAKKTNVPIFLVGHVTKQGVVAGPKVLEHLVDTVLQFEGDSKHEFRMLRAVKNRFGPTDEVGVFAMHDTGLHEVKNPSDLFLGDVSRNIAGSVTVSTMQGTRPVLVEIQALVNNTNLSIPRRVATGINERRLQIICAILNKHAGIKLGERDVFVNVAGGLKIREPAVDLGICLAIASSYKNKPLPPNSIAIGEVGLLGEIRRVAFYDKRVKEAKSQGYIKIIDSTKFKKISEVVEIL